MAENMSREQIIIRSRQLNPCDQLFWKSRGYSERPWNWRDVLEQIGYYDDNESEEDEDEYEDEDEEEEDSYDEDEYDSEENEYDSDEDERRLKSNQNNPNNDEFWKLRGYIHGRPDNWQEIWYGR